MLSRSNTTILAIAGLLIGLANPLNAQIASETPPDIDATNRFSVATTRVSEPSLKLFGFGPVSDSKLKQLREDVAIFNRLVLKSLPTSTSRNTMGVTVTRNYGKNDVFCVEGRGLIFVYHVGFPVAKSEDKQNPEPTPGSATGDWEKAREELRASKSGRSGLISRAQYSDFRKANYDQDQVDSLDRVIKKALSNAGKIRNMVSSESVTVYVYGSAVRDGKTTVMAWKANASDADSNGKVAENRIQSVQYLESQSKREMFFGTYQTAPSKRGISR